MPLLALSSRQTFPRPHRNRRQRKPCRAFPSPSARPWMRPRNGWSRRRSSNAPATSFKPREFWASPRARCTDIFPLRISDCHQPKWQCDAATLAQGTTQEVSNSLAQRDARFAICYDELRYLFTIVRWNLARCDYNENKLSGKGKTLQKLLEYRDSRTLSKCGTRSANKASNRVKHRHQISVQCQLHSPNKLGNL